MTGRRRGSAILELTFSASFLVALLAGAVQYGHTFFVYGQLQEAVRNGARYASMRPFTAGSPACIVKMQDDVRGMVADASKAVGLNPSQVTVTYQTDSKGVPDAVTVSIDGFTVDALFSIYTFRGKPSITVPYLGRYAPTECEP